MDQKIVALSKALMQKQTRINRSPVWELTQIAIKKGKELSKKYKVDENLVLSALYLAHTVFDTDIKGAIQKNHENLSAGFVKSHLDKWHIDIKDQNIILNSIESHHNKKPMKTKIAEIVRNAECYKFITLKGCRIYFKELKRRGYNKEEAKKTVIKKMHSKMKLLTLRDCKKDAEKNSKYILRYIENI